MKYHISSNGENGFHGAEAERIDNTVNLKIWTANWEAAQICLEQILSAFAERGHKITSRGKIGKNLSEKELAYSPLIKI